jgi:hypothetical protein
VQQCLYSVGNLLGDELLTDGSAAQYLDKEKNPRIEFRSPVVTHAFFRWIFGQFKGDPDFKTSRWPFYSALTQALIHVGADEAEFVRTLKSLSNSWRFPNGRSQELYDHGRSSADLKALSKEIFDAVQHPQFGTKCALNLAYAEALLVHCSDERLSDQYKNEVRRDALTRLKVATSDGAPPETLLHAAYLLSSHNLELDFGEHSEGFGEILQRVLESSANRVIKQRARYMLFSRNCMSKGRVPLNSQSFHLDSENLERLSSEPRLLRWVRGMLDSLDGPDTRIQQFSLNFYSGDSRDCGVQTMVSTYSFVVTSLSKRPEFFDRIVAITGAAPSDRQHEYVANLTTLIRCAARSSVPFSEVFGQTHKVLLDEISADIGSDNFSQLPKWLSRADELLRDQLTSDLH